MIDIFENIDDTKVIVARLISSGMPVQQIAAFLCADIHSVYRLSNQIKRDVETGRKVKRGGSKRIPIEIVFPARKGRKVPKDKLNEIELLLKKTNLTPMEIARQLGMKSRSSIYRIRNAMVEKAEKRAGKFQPKAKTESKRCEKHGLVKVWPCVACEAEKYRRQFGQ